MLAVLDGPLVSDSYAGVVFNLATGEHWTAIRNEGARRNGEPVTAMRRSLAGRIERLGLERTPRHLQLAQPLVERAATTRTLGSLASSIARTTALPLDGIG